MFCVSGQFAVNSQNDTRNIISESNLIILSAYCCEKWHTAVPLSKKMAQFHVYCVMGNLQKLHQREPNISIHVFHTFPLVLTRRNCLKMKSILQG